MPKAIIIEEFGGPEVMQMVESPVLLPNSHEVTIRNTAIGLNFIDTYQAHVNLESRATTGSTILKP